MLRYPVGSSWFTRWKMRPYPDKKISTGPLLEDRFTALRQPEFRFVQGISVTVNSEMPEPSLMIDTVYAAASAKLIYLLYRVWPVCALVTVTSVLWLPRSI